MLQPQVPRLACRALPGLGNGRLRLWRSCSGAAQDSASAGQKEEPRQVQVYRQTGDRHERTFKWGVGSRWRMQSKNRFTPVHLPHPKTVTLRDDYYDSDNPNIVWEELNETW